MKGKIESTTWFIWSNINKLLLLFVLPVPYTGTIGYHACKHDAVGAEAPTNYKLGKYINFKYEKWTDFVYQMR